MVVKDLKNSHFLNDMCSLQHWGKRKSFNDSYASEGRVFHLILVIKLDDFWLNMCKIPNFPEPASGSQGSDQDLRVDSQVQGNPELRVQMQVR